MQENEQKTLDWENAKNILYMWIAEYADLGWAGQFGLNITLLPLKRRFDAGERTQELYDAIMAVK